MAVYGIFNFLLGMTVFSTKSTRYSVFQVPRGDGETSIFASVYDISYKNLRYFGKIYDAAVYMKNCLNIRNIRKKIFFKPLYFKPVRQSFLN